MDGHTTRAITLGGRSYTRASGFALAAAQAGQWAEARDLFLVGALTSWAEEASLEADVQSELRRLAHLENVSDDLRLALALKALNSAMPLVIRGEIVSPAASKEMIGILKRQQYHDGIVALAAVKYSPGGELDHGQQRDEREGEQRRDAWNPGTWQHDPSLVDCGRPG